jgi:hypothetical protein
MAIELAICRACGSDKVEVIEAGGQFEPFSCETLEEMQSAAKLFGAIAQYPGNSVGHQFFCPDCGKIADGCAIQDAGHPAVDLDELESKLRKNERGVAALAALIVKHLRGDRSITRQQAEAERRIADREQWKGVIDG